MDESTPGREGCTSHDVFPKAQRLSKLYVCPTFCGASPASISSPTHIPTSLSGRLLPQPTAHQADTLDFRAVRNAEWPMNDFVQVLCTRHLRPIPARAWKSFDVNVLIDPAQGLTHKVCEMLNMWKTRSLLLQCVASVFACSCFISSHRFETDTASYHIPIAGLTLSPLWGKERRR